MTRSTRPRISRRTREQAALICAIAASTPSMTEAYALVRVNARTDDAAYALAFGAWVQAHGDRGWSSPADPAVDAEAEALLRCGWSPGDEL